MPEVHGYCTLCRSRCGAIYRVDGDSLVDVRPDPAHPTGAAMCPKGRAAPEIVHSPERLTHPLRRTTPKSDPDPRWRRISWDEALTEIAERLGDIRDTSGPEAVAFSVTSPSGTPLSDSIDWVERFIRLFGSPNTVYSTEICNWHKDVAHAFTFGTGLPTPDYANTDLAVLWGHNPAKSWLAQSAALAEGGAPLAVVDPRRSTSALSARHWLRVRPGTDAALALGLGGLLLDAGAYDAEFVRAWSNGPLLVRTDSGRFLRAGDLDPGLSGSVAYVGWDADAQEPVPYDTAAAAVRPERFALRGRYRVPTRHGPLDCVPAFERYAEACAAWPVDRTVAVTGVGTGVLRAFADDLGQASSVAYATWSGVGQHDNATQTERAIANLYALTGSYDAPGGNVVLPKLPVNAVTSPDQLAPEQRAKALGVQRFPLGPPAQGWVSARELCRSVLTGDPYRVRALVSFGGNLLLSQPDPVRTAEALRGLEFSVHLDLFSNPTARFADIVLPVNSPWEREAVKTGFEITRQAQERVQLRPRMIPPIGESRSDTEVVFELARRLGLGERFFDGDIEAAWNHQLAPLGLDVATLREHREGTRIPLRTTYRKYAQTDDNGAVTGFATPTRRVELYSERLAAHGYSPVPLHPEREWDPRFPLTLTCAKNGYFCHSQHRGISSLRKRSPEPTVDLSARLAADRGIAEGDWVDISTRNATVRMRARVDDTLHTDVVVAEFGWWQEADDLALPGSDPLSDGGANYNLLADDDSHDPISGSVPLRSMACDVRPVDTGAWRGTRDFVVASARPVTAEVVALALRPADGGPLPAYRPGQHVTVAFDGVERSYSLTGPAHEAGRETYDIAVRRVPGGRFSTAAHERLRPGTPVAVTAPGGLFAIPTVHSRPIVLVAAGIGITPFLGYLETLASSGGDVPEVVLHHGSRDAASHVFADRIRSLAAAIGNLTVVDHHSRAASGDRGDVRRGRVRAEHVDAGLIRRRARFYLCGPGQMVDELAEGLRARGVHRFDIFAERFHSEARPVEIPDDLAVTVRFARSDRDVRWSKTDGTLLDLARGAGIALPSGCRLGQCESCAVSVLSGSVAHLVTTADLPDDQCLTCQSMPTTDVTLDA
ncbi:molybdopterin-dependent oxidoreductase [Prauserella cavernicola]|uniref:Molybdopterin-dependent oxidoreductase n=1 Tax=Prauserella cavernicola TaxID=2800127 RepID=A0A934V4R4_9PSEU|nr:molybdopterin-dependent oxidoreductase [Prauserella cavernicola]MBK1783868.1 molybdopterin-dependent oxidoreductase [Prauserella cavernicola]